MTTGNEKRQRRRSTRVRRSNETPASKEPELATHSLTTDQLAREHYRREKARRAQRTRPPEHPLEQARRAYDALLAADAERAKGGRPRKVVTTPRKPSDAGSEAKED